MHPNESKIQRLEAFCKQLVDVIEELEHELRRCTDELIRAGGKSPEYEKRMRKLLENTELNVKELEKAQKEIQQLKK